MKMKNTIGIFRTGDEVNVIRKQDDVFQNDFTGTVVGFRADQYVQVRDQDDNTWDCDPDQLELTGDEL